MANAGATAPKVAAAGLAPLDSTEVGNVLKYLSCMKQMDDVPLDENEQAIFDHGRQLILKWLANCLYDG